MGVFVVVGEVFLVLLLVGVLFPVYLDAPLLQVTARRLGLGGCPNLLRRLPVLTLRLGKSGLLVEALQNGPVFEISVFHTGNQILALQCRRLVANGSRSLLQRSLELCLQDLLPLCLVRRQGSARLALLCKSLLHLLVGVKPSQILSGHLVGSEVSVHITGANDAVCTFAEKEVRTLLGRGQVLEHGDDLLVGDRLVMLHPRLPHITEACLTSLKRQVLLQ